MNKVKIISITNQIKIKTKQRPFSYTIDKGKKVLQVLIDGKEFIWFLHKNRILRMKVDEKFLRGNNLESLKVCR